VRTVRTQVKEGVSCTDLCEARLRFLALVAYNRQNPRLRFLTPAVLNLFTHRKKKENIRKYYFSLFTGMNTVPEKVNTRPGL
jgi:hypothetical protein